MLNVDPAASTSVSVNGLTLSQLDLQTTGSNLALSHHALGLTLARGWRCLHTERMWGQRRYWRANRSFLYIKASHCVGKDTRATS